jgi:hypothetical protein
MHSNFIPRLAALLRAIGPQAGQPDNRGDRLFSGGALAPFHRETK